MGLLASLIIAQDLCSDGQTALIVVMCFAVAHELIEQREIRALESLALVQAPLVIPTIQQISTIKLDGTPEVLRNRILDLLAGDSDGIVEGLLEDVYIDPEIRMRMNLDPIMLDQQAFALGGLQKIKRGLELPYRLAKIGF